MSMDEPEMTVAEFKARQAAGTPVKIVTSRDEYLAALPTIAVHDLRAEFGPLSLGVSVKGTGNGASGVEPADEFVSGV